MEKAGPGDIRIERLKDCHDVKGFSSYEKDLMAFLNQDALGNQKNRISVTYLWFLKTGELVGYITLLNDRINLEGGLKAAFKNKDIFYRSLPALKIGRLCVDDRFLRRGLGTLMIDFAIDTANRIFKEYSGCRFIVLDAKKNTRGSPVQFYEKQGFKTLKERKGTIPMYFDLTNNDKFSA